MISGTHCFIQEIKTENHRGKVDEVGYIKNNNIHFIKSYHENEVTGQTGWRFAKYIIICNIFLLNT